MLSTISILISLLLHNRPVTTGLVIGSFLSIVFFVTLWWAVNQAFGTKKEGKRIRTGFIVAVFIFKLPLAGIALYLAFRFLSINLFALIAGIAITQTAILIAGLKRIVRRATETP